MPQSALDWIPLKLSDITADDSDKSFTVPANRVWELKWVWVELISSGDVGNRQLTLQIQDNTGDVIATLKSGAVQAASVTCNYLFAPGVADLTAFRDTAFMTNPMPEFMLPQNYIVRVFDGAAIAAAADDMVVHMLVRQYGQH